MVSRWTNKNLGKISIQWEDAEAPKVENLFDQLDGATSLLDSVHEFTLVQFADGTEIEMPPPSPPARDMGPFLLAKCSPEPF